MGHIHGYTCQGGRSSRVRKQESIGNWTRVASQGDTDLQAKAQQFTLNWTKGPDSPFEARKYNP